MEFPRCSRCDTDTRSVAVVGGLCAVCLLRAARAVDYTIINVLGESAWGTTYLAERSGTRAIAVVKVGDVRPDAQTAVECLRHAADQLAAASLSQVTCAVHAGLLAGHRPFIVRPYVRGVAVITFCHRTADRALRRYIVATVEQVLTRAHAHGIVHGNLTSSNVLISDGDAAPVVTVSDFGLHGGSLKADAAALDRLRTALL